MYVKRVCDCGRELRGATWGVRTVYHKFGGIFRRFVVKYYMAKCFMAMTDDCSACNGRDVI